MASSGLVTTMRMQLGEYLATCSVAVRTIVEIGQQQIVAAHARLARKAGGDDGDIGIGGRFVVVGAGEHYVVALNRTGLQQVESLTLRNALYHVHQDDIGEFLIRNAQRAIRADIAGAYNGNLLSQSMLLEQ